MNKWLYWFHLVAACWWSTGGIALALMFPKSVLYVSLMSAWANLISHAAAWGASRTEKRQMAQQKGT